MTRRREDKLTREPGFWFLAAYFITCAALVAYVLTHYVGAMP